MKAFNSLPVEFNPVRLRFPRSISYIQRRTQDNNDENSNQVIKIDNHRDGKPNRPRANRPMRVSEYIFILKLISIN